ncbi:MAG: outer membrane protein assembly factor BamE [Candidatus Puniceispirillum sp.]|jgi:outer membrane protein assembly factor BamE (lipoprotein component of BamABCDE complex)|uniref:outer membrane protein assembly factor BamE n=1 Tax=Candidatus Puniceispirillum sp. TaxID=2026719 RepID=UPI001EB76B51|nr:outer membrane protein assembly factor BamE [Candidatus Puniceispirillum sp.]MBT6414890.1 outer membrane protein assembly factor BamE [Candidatus Puniceispirillum sp.]
MTRRTFATMNALRALATFSFLSVALIGTSACESRISSHGHTIDEAELAKIELGKSKKSDLIFILGKPSFEGAFGSGKSYYVSQTMEEPVAGINETTSRTIVMFTIDNEDIVRAVDVLDETSGLSIAHIDEKTPTPGNTYGAIDQIFKNLKRRRATEE